MAVRLFVGNLPYDTTEEELRQHFSAVGPLSYLYLPKDKESGKPRGFAFVEFHDRAMAEEAVRRFHNQLFKGRPMAVNEARAREERPPSGPPPRPGSFQSPRAPESPAGEPPPRGDRPARNFGPDAPPRRDRSKKKSAPKGERVPKGPLREKVGGRQFFALDDDEEDYLDDDYNEEDDFATGMRDAGDDDAEGK
jgi:RNA recognition motif-containing protein